MMLSAANMNAQLSRQLLQFGSNKRIPAPIEKKGLTALAFFPEPTNCTINFRFKKNINSSVMQAQPYLASLLFSRRKRRYKINISEQFKLIHTKMPIFQIPDTVMIGWIGHELGHILDYERKTNG